MRYGALFIVEATFVLPNRRKRKHSPDAERLASACSTDDISRSLQILPNRNLLSRHAAVLYIKWVIRGQTEHGEERSATIRLVCAHLLKSPQLLCPSRESCARKSALPTSWISWTAVVWRRDQAQKGSISPITVRQFAVLARLALGCVVVDLTAGAATLLCTAPALSRAGAELACVLQLVRSTTQTRILQIYRLQRERASVLSIADGRLRRILAAARHGSLCRPSLFRARRRRAVVLHQEEWQMDGRIFADAPPRRRQSDAGDGCTQSAPVLD